MTNMKVKYNDLWFITKLLAVIKAICRVYQLMYCGILINNCLWVFLYNLILKWKINWVFLIVTFCKNNCGSKFLSNSESFSWG